MKKLLAFVAAIGLVAMMAGAASATPTAQSYTTVAWNMPSYAGATTPTWPQSLALSVVTSSPDLNALDGQLLCGHQYQIDVYKTSEKTADLLEGGVLNSPNHPPEDLISGGWGVAYKIVKTDACTPPTNPPCVEDCQPTPPPTTPPPTYKPPVYGSVAITKITDSTAGGAFTFTLTCGNFAPSTLVINIPAGSGTGSASVGGFPGGTVCTIAEVGMPPGFTLTGSSPASVTVVEGGSVGFIVTDSYAAPLVVPVPTVPVTSTEPVTQGTNDQGLMVDFTILLIVVAGGGLLFFARKSR